MPVELIKNPIKVCRIIGEQVSSTVVEEDINVPDVNPDLYRILAPSAKVVIKGCEVMTDKVMIDGQVMVNILYAADLEGRPMYSIDVAMDFNHYIDIQGVKAKMKEMVNALIQHVDCVMINSRKLAVKVIMDLFCRVEEHFDLEMPSDVRGLADIQLLREPYALKQVVAYSREHLNIKDEIILGTEFPEVNQILKSDCRIKGKDEKIQDGRLEISGTLGVDLLYNSVGDERDLHFAEVEIPFTQYIEIPTAERNMYCGVDIALNDCYVDIRETESGEKRAVAVEALLDATARLYKDAEEDIVVDAYSPSAAMEIIKDNFKMHELVGIGHSNLIVKDSISIKHGEPEIEKVCYVDVLPIVNETKIVDDKVLVEGILEVTAIYMSSYSAEPMCSMTAQIPCRHFVDLPGARMGMLCYAKCNVESISHSHINSEVIELRIVMSVTAEVLKQVEKKMVSRIEEAEGVSVDINRMPAVTIYIVQKNDTLWSIAKRYNTTVDALVRLNNIENPSKVSPGTQIMILKNIRVGK